MRKTLVILTIICLVFASMFSCCFVPEAQAAVTTVEAACPHHEEESQTAHTASQPGCDCEQIIALIKESLSFDDLEEVALTQTFFRDLKVQIVSNNLVLFTDSGPPGSDIPLYIQHSVFRI